MWKWHDLSGKPPWHSAAKITPAHALAWWVAEPGLDLSPDDRMRLDATSVAMGHCSTGDPLPLQVLLVLPPLGMLLHLVPL
eukprot:88783-Amphidinium_carterae.1